MAIAEIPIGLKIKKFRKGKGLSAKAFAAKHDIKLDNLYKWEKGTKPSDVEDFLKLESILKLENAPQGANKKLLIKDIAGASLEKEIEILAYDRIILSTLAETLAHLKKIDPEKLKENLRSKAEAEIIKLLPSELMTN